MSKLNIPETQTGFVYKKTIGHYFVQTQSSQVQCEISNRLRKTLLYPTADPSSIRRHVVDVKSIQMLDPVAVGDEVIFLPAGDGKGMIHEVLPRRSRFARREATGPFERHALEQVIVANVDMLVAVMSVAQPAPTWNLLDRYLASAESLELPALVCITKSDLIGENDDLQQSVALYRSIGYPVVMTSSVSGNGIAELRRHISGKISVLVGKSGTGKTSILNAIQPGLGLRVREVNETTGRGRHTTTNLEMIPFDGVDSSKGWLVDTPGMREFGLYQVDGMDIAQFFPEMKPLIGKCRFGLDCNHENEPECAIRKAVNDGRINPRRYQSMLKLQHDL
jgi:ribosome biogenesis GTPase / thiamine phosphate phosphatase